MKLLGALGSVGGRLCRKLDFRKTNVEMHPPLVGLLAKKNACCSMMSCCHLRFDRSPAFMGTPRPGGSAATVRRLRAYFDSRDVKLRRAAVDALTTHAHPGGFDTDLDADVNTFRGMTCYAWS